MRIRYSPRTGEVAIVCTRQDLAQLAALLQAGHGRIICSAASPSGPYAVLLESLTVDSKLGQSVIFRVTDGSILAIDGDMAKLGILAENVAEFAEAEAVEGTHWHVEYFPGHFYLGPDSAPVVFEFE